MIPRKLRLSRAQFAPATTGKRAVSAHFSVTYRPVAEGGGCAVVVSKKVAKRSVDRHLLKRRATAVLKKWCRPSFTLIVYARAGSPSLPFRELEAELTDLAANVIGSAPVVR